MRSAPLFVGLAALVFVVAVAGVLAAPEDPTGDRTAIATPDAPALDSFDTPSGDAVAVVDGEEFGTVQEAVEAAEPGETVHLSGRFDERVSIATPNLTLTTDRYAGAVIDGSGEGDVVTIDAPNVTLERVWIRNSGWDADTEDAGVFVNGTGVTVNSVRLTEVTFGVWVDGVDRVRVENSTIVGRQEVQSHAERGNGIQLWRTEDVLVLGNDITRVRDGIYFSWAEGVEATDNRLWNLRYGVHYMYSNDNRLVDNQAFSNDVGYALMVSERLHIENNTAIGNRGESGHGILVKDIEDSTLRGNVLSDNDDGLYLSNSIDNELARNLVLENGLGVHSTAGSSGQTVVNNSFVNNDMQAYTTREAVVAWNASGVGNYWSDARTADFANDGISDTRHRPAGTVERLLHEQPEAAVFAESPAFSAVRMSEDSFPVLESPGIVDHHPLLESPRDWEHYYTVRRETNANRSN